MSPDTDFLFRANDNKLLTLFIDKDTLHMQAEIAREDSLVNPTGGRDNA